MHKTSTVHTVLLSGALVLSAGCAKQLPVAEVEGVVKAGGKPLPRIRIQFYPDPHKKTLGPVSAAATDDEGRFKLLCADERMGAIVGWNRIVMTDMNVSLRRPERHGRRDDEERLLAFKVPPTRIPEKYTSPEATPLSIEIKPEKQHLEFEVKKQEITFEVSK